MKRLSKKILPLMLGVFATGLAMGQAQIANLKGINYQAVAIDQDGQEIVGANIEGKPLFEREIGVRFSITDGPNGSETYYQDEHTTTTDRYGMFSLTIGLGTTTGAGTYANLLDIPWINGDQWLQVEIAADNDGNYRMVSYEKFHAVPFAFYADDVADSSITTDKIIDGTILNADVADATLDLTSKVTSILPPANGGTGLDGSTAQNGQLLIGNGSGFSLDTLTAGRGINIVNTAGRIEISSGVQGVNSSIAGSVNIGSAGGGCPGQRTLPAGETWTSSAIPISGVALGNIVVGSLNYDLQGCMMTTSVTGNNIIKVSIFNGTGTDRCFDGGLELRVLIVE